MLNIMRKYINENDKNDIYGTMAFYKNENL